MSFLAVPLEESHIAEIRARHPKFRGEAPAQARFWSEADLDAYFASAGEVLPQEVSDSCGENCALLTRLRQKLAEARVDQAPAEYRSLCRHLRERLEDPRRLPGTAECTEVQRVKRAPELLKVPVIVERVRMWVGRRWNAAFWRREYGGDRWKCRTRAPAFETDAQRPDSLSEVCSASEYVDYVRALQRRDPSWEEEEASLAFPRASFDAWPVFCQGARPLFDRCWRQLAPPGVKDLSPRWLRQWGAVCEDMPHGDLLARLHRISILAPGAMTRLHVENHNAHAWFTQIEGSRLFFLFAPQARQLYEECGRPVDMDTVHDYAAKASPVDVFYPSQRRHPLFGEAKARHALLDPGESLVVPSGWWHCSVALEPSVTLHHPFWNVGNRGGVVDALRDLVTCERQAADMNERALRCLEELYEAIMADGDPEDSDVGD